MGDTKVSEQKYNFVCFRCGCVIRAGERMVNMSVSLETPTEDDSIEYIEGSAISSLCFGCATVLLSEAIVGDATLMMPRAQEADSGEYGEEAADGEGENNGSRGSLGVRHSSNGLRLLLDCGDGISKAASQLFTWRQIAQMLIAADPNMFGVLNEPLHQVFPRTLKRLGYHVPDWRDLQHETNPG